ncbi:MAG: sulfate adenylyltransferase subunit CysN [Bryobacteraceae bacterium]
MSTTAPAAIEDFLAQEQQKELLRFTTAGSVDDGKSTLIGRLLYDSKGVYEDQLASIEKSGLNRSSGPLDFSLLTDGLRAEREQGITIDVAYRYFSTPARKFIIADTPGHEQYTRNMATGASTAELSIVLVDARKGVLPQSRRHAFIGTLLGIPHLAVAINKMDLVDFSEEVFNRICGDFREFAAAVGAPDCVFFPISALDGDNVVTTSERTPWYRGPSLLHYLETVELNSATRFPEFRFPVQYVIRPSLDYRGYAGQMSAGTIHPGDSVMVLPSGRTSRVKAITTWEGDLPEAYPPMSVAITLDDELDISRGDMLVNPDAMPHVSRRMEATLVWMHQDPMEVEKPYLLKHTTQQVKCIIKRVRHKVDVNTLAHGETDRLELNEIGVVAVETQRPLFYDAYAANRTTGGFILIDPITNATLGAGMIREPETPLPLELETGRLTGAERYSRNGHSPAVIWMTARRELAYLLERKLFQRGCQVHVLADQEETHLLPELARISMAAGLITICSPASSATEDCARARQFAEGHSFLELQHRDIAAEDEVAAVQILEMLEARHIL